MIGRQVFRVGLLAALAVAGACDSPAKPIPVSIVSVTPPAAAVIVGTPQQFDASPRDAQGAALSGRAVTWTSTNTTVATVAASGLVTTLTPGTTTIRATIDGVAGIAGLTVLPIPVASVVVTPGTASVIAGSPQQLTASTRDAAGNVLTDRAVTWSSSDGTVATVSASGLVTTLAPGVASIEARSENISGLATITVLPVPVASVSVNLTSASMFTGATQNATAVTRDANGGTLTGRMVTWSSSNPSVATVSSSGAINGVSAGTTTITATSEGRSGNASLTVQTSVAAIASVTPATIAPGSAATIAISGFDASIGGTTVTIGGAAAPVLSATTNEIVVTVPCLVTGSAVVRVANAGISPLTRSHPVASPQRTLAVGQALVLTSSTASACNELPATGGAARYLVSVFSSATSQNTLSSFELSGNPASITAVSRVPAAASRAQPAQPLSEMDVTIARHEQQHLLMLERNRRDYEQLMSKMRALPASARQSTRRDAAADVAEGDMRSIFFTFSGGCADTTRVIRGRAIRVGTRSIIWEDSANTLQSTANTDLAGYYARIGQIYDQDQHESVRNSFADPLLRDAVTDNDGKVHMVFSQRLNNTGAAAYVTSCDQFPSNVSAGSNFGQFFYGNVPTTATPNINSSASPNGWFYFMVRTVVHEVKHIASQSARVANNAQFFEQSWLEEGTARIAEEMWVRDYLHNVPWKGNTGWGTAATNGIYCDFHPTDATCNAADALRRPSYGMRRQFNEILPKLAEPWNWSPYGDGTGQSGAVFYNTTWSLVRYAADRYATSDVTFLRALINSTSTGVTNLTQVAGASLDQIIGGWGLALFADDYPGVGSPSADIRFPTWNLRSIYAGLNAAPSWTSRFNTPFPIAPTQLSFGSFISSVSSVRGGAHAYFELSGNATAPQILALTTAGGPLSPNLRIAITRLQ